MDFNPRTYIRCDSDFTLKSYKNHKKQPVFSLEIANNLSEWNYITYITVILLEFWCESPRVFMCTWGSHQVYYVKIFVFRTINEYTKGGHESFSYLLTYYIKEISERLFETKLQ